MKLPRRPLGLPAQPALKNKPGCKGMLSSLVAAHQKEEAPAHTIVIAAAGGVVLCSRPLASKAGKGGAVDKKACARPSSKAWTKTDAGARGGQIHRTFQMVKVADKIAEGRARRLLEDVARDLEGPTLGQKPIRTCRPAVPREIEIQARHVLLT